MSAGYLADSLQELTAKGAQAPFFLFCPLSGGDRGLELLVVSPKCTHLGHEMHSFPRGIADKTIDIRKNVLFAGGVKCPV